MMSRVTPENRDRLKSAAAVAAFHVLLGYAFIAGLGFSPIREVARELKLIEVVEPPPPPPAIPPPPKRIQAKTPKPKDPE